MDSPYGPSSTNSLRFLIFGAGAIGTYVGGSLLLSGQPVVFIDREENAEFIRARGMRLRIGDETREIFDPVIFTDLESAVQAGEYDVAIIAVKSFDTLGLAQSICKVNSEFVTLLSLQNGVENERLFATHLDQSQVIAGTLTSSIRRTGPGEIVLERLRGIGIGADHPLSEDILDAFNLAGLHARLYENSQAMKWSKMLTNLLANASSAILDMTPDEIFANADLYSIEVKQIRETLAIMDAMDLPVVDLPGVPVRLLALVMSSLPVKLSQPIVRRALGRGRGGKMPSFHIDLHAGKKKSEVDYLNGAVVRYAKQLNIQTPVNRVLNDTLLGLTDGTLMIDQFAKKPDKLLALLEGNSK